MPIGSPRTRSKAQHLHCNLIIFNSERRCFQPLGKMCQFYCRRRSVVTIGQTKGWDRSMGEHAICINVSTSRTNELAMLRKSRHLFQSTQWMLNTAGISATWCAWKAVRRHTSSTHRRTHTVQARCLTHRFL